MAADQLGRVLSKCINRIESSVTSTIDKFFLDPFFPSHLQLKLIKQAPFSCGSPVLNCADQPKKKDASFRTLSKPPHQTKFSTQPSGSRQIGQNQ
jgi:hypothetical protein